MGIFAHDPLDQERPGRAWHIAALSAPMAVGVRGIRLGGVTLGQSVAVLGAGNIGLLAIPAACAAGAVEVFITAKHPLRMNATPGSWRYTSRSRRSSIPTQPVWKS